VHSEATVTAALMNDRRDMRLPLGLRMREALERLERFRVDGDAFGE